jgi:hypothetical protein
MRLLILLAHVPVWLALCWLVASTVALKWLERNMALTPVWYAATAVAAVSVALAFLRMCTWQLGPDGRRKPGRGASGSASPRGDDPKR